MDRYWAAHMELLAERPPLDLLDEDWPIWTHEAPVGPTRLAGTARVTASIIGRGCRIAGEAARSVLSANCVLEPGSKVRNSVLLPNVRVGKNCLLDHVVVDSGCVIPDRTTITPADRIAESPYYRSSGGVLLVDAAALAKATGSAARRVA